MLIIIPLFCPLNTLISACYFAWQPEVTVNRLHFVEEEELLIVNITTNKLLREHWILSYQFCSSFGRSGFITFRYDAKQNA